MSGIYPKAEAPLTEEAARFALERARRWQTRYDDAMDAALAWKERWVEEVKRRRIAEENFEMATAELEKAYYVGKHRKDIEDG